MPASNAFDAMGYNVLSGTVGTTATAFAHNLGTVPGFVILTVTGTVAGVVRVTAKDATNITVVSTLAATTFEALCIAGR